MRRTDRPGVRWEARNASGCAASATLDMINVHERTLFLAGTKLIAVISEAASAGISLHADKCAPPVFETPLKTSNKPKRNHTSASEPMAAVCQCTVCVGQAGFGSGSWRGAFGACWSVAVLYGASKFRRGLFKSVAVLNPAGGRKTNGGGCT